MHRVPSPRVLRMSSRGGFAPRGRGSFGGASRGGPPRGGFRGGFRGGRGGGEYEWIGRAADGLCSRVGRPSPTLPFLFFLTQALAVAVDMQSLRRRWCWSSALLCMHARCVMVYPCFCARACGTLGACAGLRDPCALALFFFFFFLARALHTIISF